MLCETHVAMITRQCTFINKEQIAGLDTIAVDLVYRLTCVDFRIKNNLSTSVEAIFG